MDSYSCASGNGCHDYQITIQNYNGHRSYVRNQHVNVVSLEVV